MINKVFYSVEDENDIRYLKIEKKSIQNLHLKTGK